VSILEGVLEVEGSGFEEMVAELVVKDRDIGKTGVSREDS
jgi:hypothetical protein